MNRKIVSGMIRWLVALCAAWTVGCACAAGLDGAYDLAVMHLAVGVTVIAFFAALWLLFHVVERCREYGLDLTRPERKWRQYTFRCPACNVLQAHVAPETQERFRCSGCGRSEQFPPTEGRP